MNPPLLVQEVLRPQISEGGEGTGEAPPSLHLALSWSLLLSYAGDRMCS